MSLEPLNMSGFIDGLAKLAATANKEVEGDYRNEADGLLYCGKCHTKKQTKLVDYFTKKERLFPCQCDCKRKEWEMEQARAKQQEEASERAQFLSRANQATKNVQDQDVSDWTLENDNGMQPKISVARTYVEKWPEMYAENIGFLLYGPVGTGKTYIGACIANELKKRGIPVLMTNFSKLTSELSKYGTDKNEFLNYLSAYHLLIIDDLGTERESEFVREQVYNIIDGRYKNGQPMIITTNIPIKEIQNPSDMAYKRIYDRILENCVPVEVPATEGGSFRKKASMEKIQRARELFR